MKYSIGQFAKKTGVTVRTLRYYEEIGLLIPECTKTNRRFYCDSHLSSLQKIISLKYIGLSLEKIKEYLNEEVWDLRQSLLFQRQIMEKEREKLTNIIKALDNALAVSKEQKELSPSIYVAIIDSFQMEEKSKKALKQILPEDTIDRIFNISDEEQILLNQKWVNIFVELTDLYKEGRESNSLLVQKCIEKVYDLLVSFVGEDLSLITEIKEEDFPQDLLKLPSPFSEKQQKWMDEAFEHHFTLIEKKEKG
ncbi:MerR family transcriptional regulator [Priestia filamentosa]|nr:MerR family transcriptional regulator [Priestia filamentosa]MDT3763690.1 MerR family transcriptional regulator [Priestia filamentosa]WCM17871.1 MerR family transcriptional regulator [Priestia filamentosa]WRU97624.1 MerR family transcriptional regulator [Priestia filamentosa]SMF14594.1 DNA-binding transcriptional regulator, MerR family [Priestia filamentosa]